MKWLTKCEDLLKYEFVPECPEFLDAWKAVQVSDIDAATEALSKLNEAQQLISATLIEIAFARSKDDDVNLQLLADWTNSINPDGIERADFPTDLTKAWTGEVGTKLTPAAVAKREKVGQQYLLLSVVKNLCENQRHSDARAFGTLIDEYHRRDRATAWSTIASGLSGPEQDNALMLAANAGNARPMIQDGGEEAEAHGIAIASFAAAGISADNIAVQTAIRGLLKLSKHRARKDVRSYGTIIGVVGAAKASRENRDLGWRDVAATLAEKVWDDALLSRAKLSVLIADIALGKESSAALKPVIKAHQLQDSDNNLEHLTMIADGTFSTDPILALVARRNNGEDVDSEIQSAVDEKRRSGSAQANRFENACRAEFSDDVLGKYLEDVHENQRAEAIIKGCSYGFKTNPERRLFFLKRGYPEGDRFGIYTPNFFDILTPELLEKAEVFYGKQQETGGLNLITAKYALDGDLQSAARVIGRHGQVKSSDEPWVPSYRLGNRAVTPPVVFERPDDVKATVKEAKTAFALRKIAEVVADDPEAFSIVIKASRLKKFAKKATLHELVKIRLLEDDIEDAITIAQTMAGGRFDDGRLGEVVRGIAIHVRKTDNATIEHLNSLLSIIIKVHPQSTTFGMQELGRLSAPLGDTQIDHVLKTSRSLFRCPADAAYAYSGIGLGFMDIRDGKKSEHYFNLALETGTKPTIYFKGPALSFALASAYDFLNAHFREEAIHRALKICMKHETYQSRRLEHLERSVIEMWKHNIIEPISIFLNNETVPAITRQELKRSVWADIELSPCPLKSLEGAWPSEPLTPDVATELIIAVVVALKKEDKADEAASVESLVKV